MEVLSYFRTSVFRTFVLPEVLSYESTKVLPYNVVHVQW